MTLIGQSLFKIYKVQCGKRSLAAKVMTDPTMARSELNGLAMLGKMGLPVPGVHRILQGKDRVVLLMDYLPPGNRPSKNQLVRDLIHFYSSTGSYFGWDQNNFIGNLPQPNLKFETFSRFWWNSRIKPLLDSCIQRGFFDHSFKERVNQLVLKQTDLWSLDNLPPAPVHGDLWSGNLLPSGDQFHFIDPSFAFSLPDQDLAMLQLFGSPLDPEDFETILNESGFPGKNITRRIPFFQLYPLLVHVQIFGSGYVNQVRQILSYYNF